MFNKIVKRTILCIFLTMVGAVLGVFGVAKGPIFLLWIGIGFAVVALVLFLIEFMHALSSRKQ